MAHNGNNHDLLVAWLRDAHAMEKGLIPVLENHAKDSRKRHPMMADRVQRHVEETRRHADLVEGCLKELGEDTSKMKNMMSKVMGGVQSISTGSFDDEEVKNALADIGTEHFEIACYRALIEGARATGHEGVVQVCEQILQDEEDMANFLEENLPLAVRDRVMAAA